MRQTEEHIKAIEGRLKPITGWPWFVKVVSFGASFDPQFGAIQAPHHSVCHGDTDGIALSGTSEEARANVDFVAHAPEDIDWLLKQNRRLASYVAQTPSMEAFRRKDEEIDMLRSALSRVHCICFKDAITGQDQHTSECPRKAVDEALK